MCQIVKYSELPPWEFIDDLRSILSRSSQLGIAGGQDKGRCDATEQGENICFAAFFIDDGFMLWVTLQGI